VSRRCYVVNVSQPRFDVEHKTSNSPTYAPSRYIDIFAPIITFRKPLLGGAVTFTFARYPHLFSAAHSPLDICHESMLKVDSFLQGRLSNHEVASRFPCTALPKSKCVPFLPCTRRKSTSAITVASAYASCAKNGAVDLGF
jgi:hypothetical protein